MASGAMKWADTPTVAIVSAVIGTPNIIMASILRLVSKGTSRSMLTAAVIASPEGDGLDVVVVVVFVVLSSASEAPKSPLTYGPIPNTGAMMCMQDIFFADVREDRLVKAVKRASFILRTIRCACAREAEAERGELVEELMLSLTRRQRPLSQGQFQGLH